jgi:methylamine dehydrogenase heavy chain
MRRFAVPSVLLLLGSLAQVLAPAGLRAEVPAEIIGRVERMPLPPSPHWATASDPLLERSAIIDLDNDRLLGVVDGGWGFTIPVFSRDASEIYVPETHYSRRSRGVRTDVVTFYDLETLTPQAEVEIPPKRASNTLPMANAALSDDGRLLAVFNMNPSTSLSIVDVVERRFVGEIGTPGCSLVYAAGPRRFAMLCSDGALLLIQLDESGRLESRRRSQPFFDPQVDPVTEKAVRWGDTWLFVSFDGFVHPVDVSGSEPVFGPRWSLFTKPERREGWRIGGSRHLAVHQSSGRFYSLVHRGEQDSHKDGGKTVFVYDLATQERVQRIDLYSVGLTYLGIPVGFGENWIWPFNRLYDGLLGLAGDALGVEEISVTQDERPLLVTAANYAGVVAIYDAQSGDFLGRVTTGNMTVLGLQTPFAAGGR